MTNDRPMKGLGLYGSSMHDFVMRELEIGFRAAMFEDSEMCGFGALFDLQYETYMKERLMSENFVVVTVADNGVIHAWGDDNGQPFTSRSQASAMVRKMKAEYVDNYGLSKASEIVYRTCTILGDPNL